MGSEVKVMSMGSGRMEALVGKRHLDPAFFLSGGQDSLLANKGNKLTNSPKGSPQHGREAGGGA